MKYIIMSLSIFSIFTAYAADHSLCHSYYQSYNTVRGHFLAPVVLGKDGTIKEGDWIKGFNKSSNPQRYLNSNIFGGRYHDIVTEVHWDDRKLKQITDVVEVKNRKGFNAIIQSRANEIGYFNVGQEHNFKYVDGKCVPWSRYQKTINEKGKEEIELNFSVDVCKSLNKFFKKNPSWKTCLGQNLNSELTELLESFDGVNVESWGPTGKATSFLEECDEYGLKDYYAPTPISDTEPTNGETKAM